MLFGIISLKGVNVKPGIGNVSDWSKIIFNLLYTAAYACVIGFSWRFLELFDDKSPANVPLIMLNVLSLLLAMGSAWRGLRNTSENDARFVFRNAFSAVALLSIFLLLGVEDNSSVKLDRDWVNVVVSLVAVTHGLQVFINKENPDEPDACDTPPTLGEKVVLDLLLAGSVTFLVLHLYLEDNNSGLLFERGDTKSHVLISSLLLISVHLLLEGVTRILEQNPCGLQTVVINLLTCYNKQSDEKMGLVAHCPTEGDIQEILPLNRIPLYRHLVTSSVIACLSYSLGLAINSTNYIHLFISLLLYLIADGFGRGNDRVTG